MCHRAAEELEIWEREERKWHAAKGCRVKSNPGLLQPGHSLCTWRMPALPDELPGWSLEIWELNCLICTNQIGLGTRKTCSLFIWQTGLQFSRLKSVLVHAGPVTATFLMWDGSDAMTDRGVIPVHTWSHMIDCWTFRWRPVHDHVWIKILFLLCLFFCSVFNKSLITQQRQRGM